MFYMTSNNFWDDITKYKKCKKKQYDIHVCMPPKGTVIVNKLEQADTVEMLRGKTYFTVDELNKMKSNSDTRLNIVKQAVKYNKAYLINDKENFVLAGIDGELWVIDVKTLANKYSFLSNNQPVAITQMTLNKRLVDGKLDWTVVRTKPDMNGSFACFVPKSMKGQIKTSDGIVLNINDMRVSHGKGDFVIADASGSKPNLNSKRVVNGNVFTTTYDNRGWEDNLDLSHQKPVLDISKLPNLF